MKPTELLVVMVPRARRDDVVDILMGCAELEGFSLMAAGGFSREYAQLDLRERVQGYRDNERFDVLCDPALRSELLARLTVIAGTDRFHYWVVPLLETGTIGAA